MRPMFNTGFSPSLRSLEVCLCAKIHVSRMFYGITAQYCDGAMSEHWGWGNGWGRYGSFICESEDLSSNSQHSNKKFGMAVEPVPWERNRRMTGA